MTIQVTKTFTTQTTRMLVGERGQAVIMVATEEELQFLSSTDRSLLAAPQVEGSLGTGKIS